MLRSPIRCTSPSPVRLLGSSAAMQEVLRLIERVAPTEASVRAHAGAAGCARTCSTGLAVFPINLLPLRHRGHDVELLAEHFLAEQNGRAGTAKRLSLLARATLKQHSWPGNVRELKNSIEGAFILTDPTLELAPLVQTSASRGEADPRAADALGCSLKTLYNKLNGYSQNQPCASS